MSMFRFGTVRSPPRRPLVQGSEQSPFCTSPSQLQDVTLDQQLDGTIPFTVGLRSPGKMSPIRGRTMKEYEEQLSHLKKENFNLKLRIYFLEERMGHIGGPEETENAIKKNIELKVETETLRKEISEKQDLLCQAAQALDLLEEQHKKQLEKLCRNGDADKALLETRIQELEKELKKHDELGMFPSSSGYGDTLKQFPNVQCINHHTHEEVQELEQRIQQLQKQVVELESNLEEESNKSEKLEMEVRNSQEEVQQEHVRRTELLSKLADRSQKLEELAEEIASKDQSINECNGRIRLLEEALSVKEPEIQIKVQELTERDRIIQEKDNQIEKQNRVLVEIQITLDEKQKQIEALRSSLAARDKIITDLEKKLAKVEANAKNLQASLEISKQEAERLREEAEQLRVAHRRARGRELSDPNLDIPLRRTHHRDFGNDQERKSREDKDATWKLDIKERLEQLEKLEERARENEQKFQEIQKLVMEKDGKIKTMEETYNKACRTIQGFVAKMKEKCKETEQLKLDVKKRDRKIRDLMGELNEVKDMFNKAKWEAKQGSGFDDVKDMTEEENERLWAELEDKNVKLVQATEERDRVSIEMEKQVQTMLKSLREKQARLEEYEQKMVNQTEEAEIKDQQIQKLEQEITLLKSQLQQSVANEKVQDEKCDQSVNIKLTSNSELEAELARKTEELESKKKEIDCLNTELKKHTSNLQQLINMELWDKNKQIEKLQDKLNKICEKKELEIMAMQEVVNGRDMQLKFLQEKVTELGVHVNLPSALIKEMKSSFTPDSLVQQPITFNQNISHIHLPSTDVQCREQLHSESTDSGQSSEVLSEEVQSLRDQLQSSLEERKYLCRKVEELKDKLRNTPERENDNKLQVLKADLAKSKEELEKLQSQCKIYEEQLKSGPEQLHTEIKNLRSELESVKHGAEINMTELQETIQQYESEIRILHQSLVESGNACNLLRVRLEELAGFLESLLHRKELALAPRRRNALQQAIDRSRELSRTLSMSLSASLCHSLSQSHPMLQNTTLSQFVSLSVDQTHDSIGFSSTSQCSSLSFQEGAVAEIWTDSAIGEPALGHKVSENSSSDAKDGTLRDVTLTPDLSHSSVLVQLNEEIEKKNKELEEQVEKLYFVTKELNEQTVKAEKLDQIITEKNKLLTDQSQLINKLRSEVETLLEEVRQRDIELSLANNEKIRVLRDSPSISIPANVTDQGLSPGCPSDVLSKNSSGSMKTIWKAGCVDKSPSSRSSRSPSAGAIQDQCNKRPVNSLSSMTFYNSHLVDGRGAAQWTSPIRPKACAIQVTSCPPHGVYKVHNANTLLPMSSSLSCSSLTRLQRSASDMHNIRNQYVYTRVADDAPSCRQALFGSKGSSRVKRSSSTNTFVVPQQHLEQSVFVAQQDQHAASHSESEAWSEPDRKVSMARIGLEQDSLLLAEKSPHIRTRVTRSHGLDESSDSEDSSREIRTPGKRTRSEMTEVRRLQNKLRCMEQVNEALRTELHIYQSLGKQLTSQESGTLDSKDTSMNASKLGNEFITGPGSSVPISTHLLKEIHVQREKLESSLLHNEFIKQQLESAFASLSGGQAEESVKYLCKKVRDTTDQLEDARMKCGDLESKLEQVMSQLEECHVKQRRTAIVQEELEITKKTVRVLQEKVTVLEVQIQEKENDILEKQCTILELQNKIKVHEVKTLEVERQNRELEDKLSTSNEKITGHEETIASLREMVTVKEREIENWKEKYNTYIQECEKSHSNQLQEIQIQLNEKVIALSELTLQKTKLDNEKLRLEQEVKLQKNQIVELSLDKKEAENELRVCEERLKTLEELEGQVAKGNDECNEHVKGLRELESQNLELKSKITCLERNIEQYELFIARRRRRSDKLAVTTMKEHHSEQEISLCGQHSGTCTTILPVQTDMLSPSSCSSFDYIQEDNTYSCASESSLKQDRDGQRPEIIIGDSIAKDSGDSSAMSSLQLGYSRQRSEMSDYVSDQTLEEFEAAYNQSCNNYWFNVQRSGELSARNIYSSPDLGIESDTGRFSSLDPPLQASHSDSAQNKILERQCQEMIDMAPSSLESRGDGTDIGRSRVEDPDCRKLRDENEELKLRLCQTNKALQATLSQLEVANKRKKQVEKAICKQLHKTHHILRKARVNLEAGYRHSDENL